MKATKLEDSRHLQDNITALSCIAEGHAKQLPGWEAVNDAAAPTPGLLTASTTTHRRWTSTMRSTAHSGCHPPLATAWEDSAGVDAKEMAVAWLNAEVDAPTILSSQAQEEQSDGIAGGSPASTPANIRLTTR